MKLIARAWSEEIPRIIVIGARGQIGFELVRHLQGLGRIYTPSRAELDLSSPDSINALIARIRPAVVVNAAAYTDVARAEQEIDLSNQINAVAPGLLAQAARECGATLIHYSTDYVFDGTKSGAYQEDDTTGALNQYGRGKLAGELAVAQAGASHMIFRTSWVYGLRGRNFLNFVLREISLGHDLRIVADQFGAPTWSRTAAALTTHVIQQGLAQGESQQAFWRLRSGVYHLTPSGVASWHAFAKAILDLLPQDQQSQLTAISSAEFASPVQRPVNSSLDTGKFERVFGLSVPNWLEALKWCLER